jgi:hypothetical protein
VWIKRWFNGVPNEQETSVAIIALFDGFQTWETRETALNMQGL